MNHHTSEQELMRRWRRWVSRRAVERRTGAFTGVVAVIAVTAAVSLHGCIDLSPLFPGPPMANTNDNATNPDGSPSSSPRASLRVNNPTPQVNDEVILTCALAGILNPPDGPVTFEFAPNTGQLVIDAGRGIARYIVTDADRNTTSRFTCRAVTAGGVRGPDSNAVLITVMPGDGGAPPPP